MSLLKHAFGDNGSGDAPGEEVNVGAAEPLVRVAAAQRVRVGLTGLAAIFLLVMVAAAGMRPAPTAVPADAQAEPLAVLGVAPGAGPASLARPADTQGATRQATHN